MKKGIVLICVLASLSIFSSCTSPKNDTRTGGTNQYMALFIWLWQHKGLPLADKELLLKRTIADSYDYAENYDKIKVRPMDINTKGEFPQVV